MCTSWYSEENWEDQRINSVFSSQLGSNMCETQF